MTAHEPRPGTIRVVTVEDTCPDCRGITLVIPAVGLVEPTHDDSCPTRADPPNLKAMLDWIDADPRTRQLPPDEHEQPSTNTEDTSEDHDKQTNQDPE